MRHPIIYGENRFTSSLREQLYRFLEIKRATGCKYEEEERSLFVMDQFLNSALSEGSPFINHDIARKYLTRWDRENDTTRSHRLSLLRQVCWFLSLEDPRTFIPPKRFMGIKRCHFSPRILTHTEGKRFGDACLTFPSAHCSPLRGTVLGTALLLLYLTGLRAGEVLRLSVQDVDFQSKALHIRDTKFGKSRLVPVAQDLIECLHVCHDSISKRLGQRGSQDPFFCTSKGKPYSATALYDAFRQTLARADIKWIGKGEGPRMHDLRHSVAVLRMLLWYKEGVDLEVKLPLLATYLGHKNLLSTQRYLHLTQDLLGVIASRYQARFGHLIEDMEGRHEKP